MTPPGRLGFGFGDYLSPFTWRYGSREMRLLWSEESRRRTWRTVWLALARAQAAHDLLTGEELQELASAAERLDLTASLEREEAIGHDLMAELLVLAERAGPAGGKLHLGATSADITDNADLLRVRAALELLVRRLDGLLLALARRIEELAEVPTLGFTHLQPAEPTTMGYRLALYAQDLWWDREDLLRLRGRLRAKGFRGAVGTAASYQALLGERAGAMEAAALQELGLEPALISGQTYPRKQDAWLLDALSGLAASLHKLSVDLRLLQSPLSGEWAEPFGRQQVGSSAMPSKQNPVQMEKVSSLARYVAALAAPAWANAALSWLERSLDDSASRRILLPEAFLACEECLLATRRTVERLRVRPERADALLERFAAFAGLEPLLLRLVARGADRQAVHERLRAHALDCADGAQLRARLLADSEIRSRMEAEELERALEVRGHLGSAPDRARELARRIRGEVSAAG